MPQLTDPQQVMRAVKRAQTKARARRQLSAEAFGNGVDLGGSSGGDSPLTLQYQQWISGRQVGSYLPRDPEQFLNALFGPLEPIRPGPVNLPEPDTERPAPRVREMPPGWNMPVGMPGTEGMKLANFQTLRLYADLYSVARSCIQVRKAEIRGMEWDIHPTPEAQKRMQGDRKAHIDFAERREIAIKFFRKPDPDYFKFGTWIDAVMEEVLVPDALSLYLHPTRIPGKGPFGSDIAAMELVSGDTIRPLVNVRGARPKPPSPAFQQYLYGVPRVDLQTIQLGGDIDEDDFGKPLREYRGDRLLYVPYTPRAWTPYGFPPLERAVVPVVTGLRKQQWQMDYFDEGTIPGNYISPGENLNWTPQQTENWMNQMNALAGDPAYKHKSITLPPGSNVFPMRPTQLADQFDEIIMAEVCMAYDVMPMELGIMPRVSTTQSFGAAHQMAKASQQTNERKSLRPLLAFLTDIFNVLIQDIWQQWDMRFVFEGLEEDEDENSLVERLVQQLSFGLASIDECRQILGRTPWGLPVTSDPGIFTVAGGFVPLGSIDPTTGEAIGATHVEEGPRFSATTYMPDDIAQFTEAVPPGTAPDGGGGSSAGGETNKPAQKPMPSEPPTPVESETDMHRQLRADYEQGKPMAAPVRPPTAELQPPAPSVKAMLSELDALGRHLRKGEHSIGFKSVLDDWQCQHVPGMVIDQLSSYLAWLPVHEATEVAKAFIIQCYGTPGMLTKQLAARYADAKTVYNQLLKDYPDKSIEWVLGARWVGPVEVPWEQIDTRAKHAWRASRETDKVTRFMDDIEHHRKHLHPVVMVKEPSNSGFRVIDGHHRTLAYHRLAQPIPAYIGYVRTDKGPWLETHLYQRVSNDPDSTEYSPGKK